MHGKHFHKSTPHRKVKEEGEQERRGTLAIPLWKGTSLDSRCALVPQSDKWVYLRESFEEAETSGGGMDLETEGKGGIMRDSCV